MSEYLSLPQIVATVVYTVIGAVVFGVAFAAMVKLSPFSIRKELEEDQNIALAVLFGSVVIGLSIIIAASVMG